MMRLPVYSKREMVMMMEYGFTISEVAHDRKLPLSPEVIQRLEDILIKELKYKSWKQVCIEMIPNILAAFETK
jgi:hypothetical protein